MKNFNPEAALAGADVRTRNGKEVIIMDYAQDTRIFSVVYYGRFGAKRRQYDYKGHELGRRSRPATDLMMADDNYAEKLLQGAYHREMIEQPTIHEIII